MSVTTKYPFGQSATIGGVQYVLVQSLPDASASTMGPIYLVPRSGSAIKDMYVTAVSGSSYVWTPIGDTTIDLAGFIVNDLTTGGTDKALSAEQGKVLNNNLAQSVASIKRYDNWQSVSRASISFPSDTQVTIGNGYIYFRKGNTVDKSIQHSETTYTFSGSQYLCYDTVAGTMAVKSTPETNDIVLIWHDGVVGFRGGLLFDEYIISLIGSNDATNYDNFNAISRASVTFPAQNQVLIGDGYIYIRKGSLVVASISHTEATYTFSGTGFLCYNLSTRVVSTKAAEAIATNDVILLWFDGTKGFRAGLLFGEFVLANSGGGGGGGGGLDNLDAVSRATISFPANNQVTIGAGYIYIRKGSGFSQTISIASQQTYTFTQTSMLCYNTSTHAVAIKSGSELTENDVILLWYDGGVVAFRAGLLYDEYLRLKADSGYPPMEYVLPSSAHPDDALQPMVHGATNSYPQNCATLYKLASKYRINFWENDVRPCLDGYVLAHNDDMSGYALDANGDTIPANTWLCSQKTVAQLKTLKVGIKPNTSTLVSGYENEKILTFEEYIILAKAYNAVPVVELKFGATQAQVTELYAVCAKHGMDERVIWNCYGARFQHATYIQGINPDAYILFTFNPSDETDTMKSLLDTCATYINNRNQVMVSLPWDDWDETTNGVTLLEYAQSLGLRAATWPESNTTFVAQAKAGVCNMCTNMYYGLEDNVIYYLQKHSADLVS